MSGADIPTLQAVLEYCRNWFMRETLPGEYVIDSGVLSGAPDLTDHLQSGQYYRIIGSVFNDGLHQYGNDADALTDESFSGAIWPLAVPPAVLHLATEIAAWQEQYGTAAASPFVSESFSGYSYTKASSGAASSASAGDWRTAFRRQLNQWRKV